MNWFAELMVVQLFSPEVSSISPLGSSFLMISYSLRANGDAAGFQHRWPYTTPASRFSRSVATISAPSCLASSRIFERSAWCVAFLHDTLHALQACQQFLSSDAYPSWSVPRGPSRPQDLFFRPSSVVQRAVGLLWLS